MKDFSPAVGMMTADTLAGLRHYPLAACLQATSTPDDAEARFNPASGNRMRLLYRQEARDGEGIDCEPSHRNHSGAEGFTRQVADCLKRLAPPDVRMLDGRLNSSSPHNPDCSKVSYLTAPKRLSNEFGGTIGADPAT